MNQHDILMTTDTDVSKGQTDRCPCFHTFPLDREGPFTSTLCLSYYSHQILLGYLDEGDMGFDGEKLKMVTVHWWDHTL